MKVLVTRQFNLAMRKLSKAAQQEASKLFSLASAQSREQLTASPLLTRLERATNPIYTLRSKAVRVFCSFDMGGDLLFLDAEEVTGPSQFTATKTKGETTLFGQRGEPKAYIDEDDEYTVYSFDGRPLAYVEEDGSIFSFQGRHLGWLEEGIVWDHTGRRVGFTPSTCPTFTQFEPFKGFKHFKPFKGFKHLVPIRPLKSLQNSSVDLLDFLSSRAQ